MVLRLNAATAFECYECLRMLTNGLENVTNVLMNDTNVLPTLPLSCHFLTSNANIWWRGCDWYKYGVNMTLGSLFCLNLTVVRHSQGMGNGERYKRLANALRTLRVLPNALPTLSMACECLRILKANDSISLKFRRRFLNWPIFVSRWRMTCERSEFVTSAYKYSASVTNFERMSNLPIRKHIRKHIRLCVRAALVKKIPLLPYKKCLVFFNRFILCSSPQQTLQKCLF